MWMLILPYLLPVAVRLIGMAFERKLLNDEARRSYLNFVQAMMKSGNTSEKSRQTFKRLHLKLVEMEKGNVTRL